MYRARLRGLAPAEMPTAAEPPLTAPGQSNASHPANSKVAKTDVSLFWRPLNEESRPDSQGKENLRWGKDKVRKAITNKKTRDL